MAETLFDELKRYVHFSEQDEASLRDFHPHAQPHFQRIAVLFYDRILDHAEARKALEGGESQVGRLKVTLIAWMDELLKGPWDDRYYERRAKIGRVHVRIALPQHYMFGAMNVVRIELLELIGRQPDTAWRARVRAAVEKILDLELGIMLHTYREDLLAQQARVERLSTFGQLVGSIGHELRNPLAVIETSLHLLKNRVGEDDRAKKHTERIGQQLGVANEIITNLLDMIRDRPLAVEAVSLPEVIDAAVQAVHPPESVRLTREGLEGLAAVKGDRAQLRQVFVNLIDNAVHAAEQNEGEQLVRVSGRTTSSWVEVEVEDSGAGVPPEIRARLFEPLVTGKVKGIGLGLALVKRIVERHGGTIAHRPQSTGGARFVVRLPREVA